MERPDTLADYVERNSVHYVTEKADGDGIIDRRLSFLACTALVLYNFSMSEVFQRDDSAHTFALFLRFSFTPLLCKLNILQSLVFVEIYELELRFK
jgi:hypothetical protein